METLSLARWRQRRMLAIRPLAELAGVAPKTIHDIEGGRVASPRFESIRRIAAALAVEPEQVQEFRSALGYDDAAEDAH